MSRNLDLTTAAGRQRDFEAICTSLSTYFKHTARCATLYCVFDLCRILSGKRRRLRSTATSVEEAEKKGGRRRSIRSNAPTPSPLRAHRSSSLASSQGSSIVSTVPAPPTETEPAREAQVDPPPRQPLSRPRSSRQNFFILGQFAICQQLLALGLQYHLAFT